MMKTLVLLGVVCKLVLVAGLSSCHEAKTCKECIGYAQDRCVWCAQDAKPNVPRCQSQADLLTLEKNWCSALHIQNPESSEPIIRQNLNFSSSGKVVVQLRPQKIKFKLRPGLPKSINLYYQPAEDYPLDVYFLVDNSYTMLSYAKELSEQAKNVYDALTKMTNNVRIGFGTFVEKPLLPFTDPVTKNSYNYKHHVSLTQDMALFKNAVGSYSQNSGSNYDHPESGLDALMQAMVCNEQIGWRDAIKTSTIHSPKSRRIIILATDDTYHSAGDGKIVGAFKPNDMQCHLLNSTNMTDSVSSKEMDYPSVSQINYVAHNNDIQLVFSVRKPVLDVYSLLAAALQGEAIELKDAAMVKTVKDAYMKASRTSRISVKNKSDVLNVTTDCGNCQSTKENPTVTINVTVVATKCHIGKSLDFDIKVDGIPDRVTIEVEVDCTCDCENKETDMSLDCHYNGVKSCGICKCSKDRSGETCDILCSNENEKENRKYCKKDVEDAMYCNGRGSCKCGKCECETGFSGTFCEHNDIECRKHCPIKQGDCKRGECVCKEQWTGPSCDCRVSNETCIGPFSKDVCSGRGNCHCGECSCDKNGIDYFGLSCESCTDCTKDQCELLKEYAICSFEKRLKSDCDKSFTKTTVDIVTLMSKDKLQNETTGTTCRKNVDNGDILVYKFKIEKNLLTNKIELELMLQDELEAAPVVNIWLTVGAVIGAILLIGLLTLVIWKVSTYLYDKREYEKFCKEATDQGFDVMNPCYLDPMGNFKNPTYQPDVN